MAETHNSYGCKVILKVGLVIAVFCMSVAEAASGARQVKHYNRPTREFLYLVSDDGLFGYTAKTDGTLQRINTSYPLIGQFPYYVIAKPQGRFLYVCGAAARNNNHDGTVYEYSIAPSGKLALINAVGAGSLPSLMAFHPSGRFLYCSSQDALANKNIIFEYRVKQNGALVPITSRPATLDLGPIFSMAVDHSGNFLFLTFRDSIRSFRINANGTLHALPAYTLKTKGNAYIAVNPKGNYAYAVSDGSNELLEFSISRSGQLVPLASKTIRAGRLSPSIAIAPSGRFLYAVCEDGIYQYNIGADGRLHSLLLPRLAVNPFGGRLTVTRSDLFAYLTLTGNEAGHIEQFHVKNGLLTPFKHPFLATGTSPSSLAITYR